MPIRCTDATRPKPKLRRLSHDDGYEMASVSRSLDGRQRCSVPIARNRNVKPRQFILAGVCIEAFVVEPQ